MAQNIRRPSMPLAWVTIAIASAALVLASCGGGSSPTGAAVSAGAQATPAAASTGPSTSQASAGAATSADACTVVTPAEAEALLGGAPGPAFPIGGDGDSVCDYTVLGPGAHGIQIDLFTKPTAVTRFSEFKAQFPTAVDVAGLGDGAYWAAAPNGSITFVALKGGAMLTVVTHPASTGPPDQPTELAALQRFVEAALARL